MSKRFNISLGLEEMELEVDKVAEATIEDKSVPETEKVLDAAVAATEEPVVTSPVEASTTPEAPVEVPADTTTLDGSEAPTDPVVETTPPVEVPAVETPVEETPAVVAEEKPAETPVDVPVEETPVVEDKPSDETPKEDETPVVAEVDEDANAVATENWEAHLKKKLEVIKKLQSEIPHIKAKIAKEKASKKKKVGKEEFAEDSQPAVSAAEIEEEMPTAPPTPEATDDVINKILLDDEDDTVYSDEEILATEGWKGAIIGALVAPWFGVAMIPGAVIGHIWQELAKSDSVKEIKLKAELKKLKQAVKDGKAKQSELDKKEAEIAKFNDKVSKDREKFIKENKDQIKSVKTKVAKEELTEVIPVETLVETAVAETPDVTEESSDADKLALIDRVLAKLKDTSTPEEVAVVAETPVAEVTPVVEELSETAPVVEPEVSSVPTEEAPVVPVETPSETVAVALEEPETVEVAEVTDNAPLVEIDEAIKENEDNTAQVDDALDVVTALEEIANELEGSLETGGLTPIAASMVDIATTDLYSQVGLDKPESETLAIENFQSSSLRIRNTKLAIEAINEAVAGIFKAIVAAIVRAIKWVKDFINNFFKNFDSMNAKIDNLLKAFALIDKTTASKLDVSNQKYDNEAIINKLKSGKDSNPFHGVNNLVTFAENYFKNVETERSNAIKKIQSMLAKLKDSDVTLPENIQLDFSLHGMVKGSVPGYKAGSTNLDSYVSNVVMSSDSEFIYFIPKDGLNDEEYLAAAKESKFLIGISPDATTVASIPYLMSSEVNSFLRNLSIICKVGNDSKVLFNNFIKDKEELSKELNNLMKTKTPSNTKFGSAIMTRIQMYDHTFISGSAALSKLMMNTLSAGIVYSTECVKVYTEAAKATA